MGFSACPAIWSEVTEPHIIVLHKLMFIISTTYWHTFMKVVGMVMVIGFSIYQGLG